MKNMEYTDWTEYYNKERSKFSTYTQQFTLDIIVSEIKKQCKDNKSIKILELGGGNSCFAESICERVNIDTYDIVDNNQLAVDLYNQKKLKANHYKGYCINLLDENGCGTLKDDYDFVFSIGLIEHFRGDDIERLIMRHFNCCNEKGVVFVTFPTPTFKYRFFRKMMELTGTWRFYDERALSYDEVKMAFGKYGEVLNHFINKKLFLTQMVVISVKRNSN